MKTKILSLLMAVVMVFSVGSIAVSAESLTEVPEGYTGVYTKEDLFAVRETLSGKYILMNDIIFDDADYVIGGDFYNSGKGWEPIGTAEKPFYGTFDGNGYKISNVRISGDVSYAGLFGVVKNKTIIKNLYIENINIDVTGSYIGGIVGEINASNEDPNKKYCIDNCIVSGHINGQNYVGGFCGYVATHGEYASYLFNNCCNLANVTGDSYIGGFTGYQYGHATSGGYEGAKGNKSYIRNCVNTGGIKGNTHVGGIIGKTFRGYGTGTYGGVTLGGSFAIIYIYDTYNSGTVNCLQYGGGIIGSVEYQSGTKENSISLENCYNSGNIVASELNNFGALLGTGYSKITNAYYLDNSVVDATKKIGTSLTSEQLKTTDFGDNWTFDGCEKYEYPELINVKHMLQLSGSATVAGDTTYGSVLEVTINDIAPEFANIHIQWIVDGAVVGTESTYTITENDIGKTIYVKICSDDGIIGSFTSNSITATKAEQEKFPASASVIDRGITSFSVNVTDGQEYSIDNENWNTTGEFISLEANTQYTIFTRIAETDTYFASKSFICGEVVTLKEIIVVEDSTENENDKQLIYDIIGDFKTEIFDVATNETDGTSLVKIPVPEDFNAETIELFDITNGTIVKTDFNIKDGFICFETTASGKFAIVDKSQILEKEPEEDTTEPEEPEEGTTVPENPEEDTTAPEKSEEDTTMPEKDEENKCICACHNEDSFIGFFYKIVRFLRTLFGLDFCRQCKCDYV